MPKSPSYLLRTEAQVAAFRERCGPVIASSSEALEKWFNKLPIYQWVQFKPPAGEEWIITGILCLLYLEGRINITFSKGMDYIQRGALSPEEYQEWAKASFRKTYAK